MAIDQRRILEPLLNSNVVDQAQREVDSYQSQLEGLRELKMQKDAERKAEMEKQVGSQLDQLLGASSVSDGAKTASSTQTPVNASFDYQNPLNASYRITQRYGNHNPGLYSGITPNATHTGVDLATPQNTQVSAPISGEVVAGTDKYWGNYVILKGDDGVEYRFSHLSKPMASGRVSAGQPIGLTGNSGHSTGPHLDISTKINGQFVDPLSLESMKRYIGA